MGVVESKTEGLYFLDPKRILGYHTPCLLPSARSWKTPNLKSFSNVALALKHRGLVFWVALRVGERHHIHRLRDVPKVSGKLYYTILYYTFLVQQPAVPRRDVSAPKRIQKGRTGGFRETL